MSSAVTCPGCRAEVSIPPDHLEPTIRCGICWNEVSLPYQTPTVIPTPAKPNPHSTHNTPASRPIARRPAPTLPGKPLPGMAKLEDRLQRAAARLEPAASPVPTSVAAIPVAARAVATAVPIETAPLVEIQPIASPRMPQSVHMVGKSEPDADDADSPNDLPFRSRPSRTRSSTTALRRHRRDDTDEDDEIDERPRLRERRSRKESPVPLIMGILVFLGIVVGGIYLLARSMRGPVDRDIIPLLADGNDPAMEFNLPDPDAPPPDGPVPGRGDPAKGFNLFPNIPNMPNVPPAAAKIVFVDYEGDGYKCKMFARPNESPSIMNLYDDQFLIAHTRTKRVRGMMSSPSMTIEISTADVPVGVNPDLKRIISEAVFRRSDVTTTALAGHKGFEHIDEIAGRQTVARIVQVGCRIFLVKFSLLDIFGDRTKAESARKEFFDSFQITFDPKTPAPVDATLVPRQKSPPRPKAPIRP